MTVGPDRAQWNVKVFAELAAEVPGGFLKRLGSTAKIDADSMVAELGCGSGVWVRHFASGVRFVVGVDRSREMLRTARRMVIDDGSPAPAYVEAEAVTFLSSVPVAFDWIYAHEALHLLTSDDLPKALARALSPGGRLSVAWHHDSWEDLVRAQIEPVFRRHRVTLGDWTYWECPEVLQILRASQREVRELTGVSQSVERIWTSSAVAEFLLSIDHLRHVDGAELLARDLKEVVEETLPEVDRYRTSYFARTFVVS